MRPDEGPRRRAKRVAVRTKKGDRQGATRCVTDARDLLRQRGHADPVALRVTSRQAVRPSVSTAPRKKGGASYPVPYPRAAPRRASLAVRWVAEAARHRVAKGKGLGRAQGLAAEIHAIAEDRAGPGTSRASLARAKKTATHKTARSNRVFAHLRRS